LEFTTHGPHAQQSPPADGAGKPSQAIAEQTETALGPAGGKRVRRILTGDRGTWGNRKLTDPRRWQLWSLPRAALVYILIFETVVLAGVVWLAGTSTTPTSGDWLRFGALAVAVIVHLLLVKRSEEDRRDAASGPFFALSSVWTFAAVISLPGSLAIAVAVLVRLFTYPIARRQPYRYLFSSAEILASMMPAILVIRAIDVQFHADVEGLGQLTDVASITVAAGLYLGVQAMAVGVAMKLTVPSTPWRDVFGSRTDNLLEAITLGGGMLLGMLMTDYWTGPVVALFPVVIGNRLWDGLRQRQLHLMRLLREQRQVHQQLTKDAHTDYRTGLLNTNGLAEYAGRVVQRSKQSGQPATVLAIDLDHFKRINDTWGHPAGNAVLAEVGRILRDKLRPTDVAGRDGGEEFVVVLADTPLAQGVTIAERIREAIAELTVPTTDKHRNKVTLRGRGLSAVQGPGPDLRAISGSIGVAVVPDNGDSLAAAQHSADAALYVAKENGRNQVQVAGLDIGLKLLPAPRNDEHPIYRSA
jgi:diguanylate cyclase (GGDEF)-like protein